MSVDMDIYPILGEPLAIELANTHYIRPGVVIDFLATSDLIVGWFDLVADQSPAVMPRRLDDARGDAIRSVRDAVRTIFSAVTEAPAAFPPPDAVSTLNRYSAASRCSYRLRWDDGQRPVAQVEPSGRGFEAAITYLAIVSVSFIAGPDLRLVRRCEAPDCPMFFVQRHHKRRFCHDGCSHRSRQARYYRNHHHARS